MAVIEKNHKCMIKLLFLSRFTRPGNQPNLCSIFLTSGIT